MKTILTLILLCFSLSLSAPPDKRLVIFEGVVITPYEAIIRAVTTIESSNGVNLINKEEMAVGWFGIRPVRLQDYNERTGKSITLDQCYSYEVGEMIFLYYVSQIDYRDIKAICRNWNGNSEKNLYYKKILKVL